MIADALDALARALREWPADAWRNVTAPPADQAGLFERLVARTAPAAVDPLRRTSVLRSAESVAAVLRVLWPAPVAQPEAVLAAG